MEILPERAKGGGEGGANFEQRETKGTAKKVAKKTRLSLMAIIFPKVFVSFVCDVRVLI